MAHDGKAHDGKAHDGKAHDDKAHESAHDLPPITTLLTPSERPRVDAAGEGCYRTLHRDSVDDLIRDLKSRQVQAVLVSSRVPARRRPGSPPWCASSRACPRSPC